MRAWFLVSSLLIGILFAACQHAEEPRPLPTVTSVDIQRYAGTWHEIARLPNHFQKANERATASYTVQPDGSVRVVNTATKPDGTSHQAIGRAWVVPDTGNARLRVKFEGLASLVPANKDGNYWIIALDEPRYRYAMVGTPDRKFLWILSRDPNLPAPVTRQLVAQAQALGFPTDELLWDPKR